MRILIAEDEPVSRRLLELTLRGWGHEVIATTDGHEAWSVMQAEDAPHLAILDWMMPGKDGLELCRLARQRERVPPTYLILLTAKSSKANIVEGLIAGANDYVTKPFDRAELRARVQVGATFVELQQKLAQRVMDLEEALAHVRLLQGILPICSYCKHVRNDQNYWLSVECYISDHTDAKFSHSICPQCYDSIVKPQIDFRNAQREAGASSNPTTTHTVEQI